MARFYSRTAARRTSEIADRHYRASGKFFDSPEWKFLETVQKRAEARFMLANCGCEICRSVAKRLGVQSVDKPLAPIEPDHEPDRLLGEVPQAEDDQQCFDEQERESR